MYSKINKNKLEVNKVAFTLMELIIVITLLIIISSIWFMSFDWYTKDSRNTLRKVDLKTIKTWIEYYYQKNLVYPTPDSYVSIIYNGDEVWKQGVFPNDIDGFNDSNNLFIDPSTLKWYWYSLLSNWREFEVSAALEPVKFISNKNTTYAESTAFLLWKALIIWTYNWKVLKVKSWSIDHIIALPSITSSVNNMDLFSIITNKKVAYNWYNNMPFNYEWTDFIVEWWFDFIPNDIVIFTWSIDVLKWDELQRNILFKNFQLAYEWTILSKDVKFLEIVATENTIDPFNITDEQKDIVKDFFDKVLKIKTYRVRN